MIKTLIQCWERCRYRQTTLSIKVHKLHSTCRRRILSSSLSQVQTRRIESTRLKDNSTSRLLFKMTMNRPKWGKFNRREGREIIIRKGRAETNRGNLETDRKKLISRKSTRSNRSCKSSSTKAIGPNSLVLEQETITQIKSKWFTILWQPKATWTKHSNSISAEMKRTRECKSSTIWRILLKLEKDLQVWKMLIKFKFWRNNKSCCNSNKNSTIHSTEAEGIRHRISSSSRWFHQVISKESNRWVNLVPPPRWAQDLDKEFRLA